MSNRAAQTEADTFGAFVRRVTRAYGRRVADRDIEALAGLAALQAEVDAVVTTAVAGLQAAGYSWADIGRQLGISRQAAQQRYARRAAVEPVGRVELIEQLTAAYAG